MFKHLPRFLTGLLLFVNLQSAISQNLDIAGPTGSERFGAPTVLTNGNYVIVDQYYDDGAIANVGAVYLFNGITHALISTLKGSTANDRVGSFGIVALPSGNFVVTSHIWHNGSVANAGAVTWINGVTGLSGIVSSSNSLVGDATARYVGSPDTYVVANGNYVVFSKSFGGGAVTWCNGNTGKSGVISSSNSFVASPGHVIGSIAVLTNGDYVIPIPGWNGSQGAALWCDGTVGRTGLTSTINSGNALIGSYGITVHALSNDNYVVISPNWNNGAVYSVGAATWCNGTTGTVGVVSAANSLIGAKDNDKIGENGLFTLANGNYVVWSPFCDNGSIVDAGAMTWGNGTTGTIGTVNTSNSLMGSKTDDINYPTFEISSSVIALPNGNYIVRCGGWDNGSTVDASSLTWGNGATGVSGVINSSNSLVGSHTNDNLGSGGISKLTNGNYVVSSPLWNNGGIPDVGAATWCNGSTGLSGVISSSNSLIGSKASDKISSSGIAALTTGNYVVSSPDWDNVTSVDVGAVTWCDGTTGTSGTVTSSNSFTGTSFNNHVGLGGSVALSNGAYVVSSPLWDKAAFGDEGAVTWRNESATTGNVTTGNSLIGNSADDQLGSGGIKVLDNGNYLVRSPNWDNNINPNSVAVTFGNGSTGLTGTVSSCNSVLGSAANGNSLLSFAYNYTHDYLIVGRGADNIVTIFDPTGLLLAVNLDGATVNIAGNNTVPLLNATGCAILGTLKPTGVNPINGTVTSQIWIESSVPAVGGDPFVARHFEVTPASNAATATGSVTLYFTQQEFTDFNNHPGSVLDLPNGPLDAVGISNLKVGKFGGISGDGSGLPGTYSGSKEVIDPADTDIVWNGRLNRWEISFDVTGFSGFFIQTKTTVLPLTLLSFNGYLDNNSGILNWKTTNEYNTHLFTIERSADGRNFSPIGNINAINQPGINHYHYKDFNVDLLGAPVLYYRIKQIDRDGASTYSSIITLTISNTKNSVVFYPNPVERDANVSITNLKREQLTIKILDIAGRVVMQRKIYVEAGRSTIPIDLHNLTKGSYYLDLKSESINTHHLFLKQ